MKLYIKKTDTVCGDFDRRLFKLSKFRQEKTLSKKQEKDRYLSLISGELLDLGLKEYGLNEIDMDYNISSHGKAQFLNYPDIKFNISHSGDFAVCVFSDSEIGVDIEKIDRSRDIERFMKRYYSENEYKFVINSKDAYAAFFMIWTRKESYLKAKGTGITVRLKDIEVLADKKDGFYFNSFIYEDMYITVCSKNYGNLKKIIV